MRYRELWKAIVLLAALAFSASSNQTATADDLLERIRKLPGVVTANEAATTLPGTRFFVIRFQQSVDHNNPSGKFLQRMNLLHRSETAPMVLALNGYYIPFTTPVVRELTAYFQCNQLHVEHRFFPPSSPKPVSWKNLTIAQSAADHHKIVESFKQLYTGKWLSTGASKGGMASVYHRFLYPDDVDATVPYVAPSSHSTSDNRYIPFVNTRGSAECRARLYDFQTAVLQKRTEMVSLMTEASFAILGEDRALEFAVLEMPFMFWQYFDASLCESIPSLDAPVSELFTFLDQVVLIASYGDDLLRRFAPYYYQAATELGAPALDEARLLPLLNYPGQNVPANYPPLAVPKEFDPDIMRAVEMWVLSRGRNFVFIYGRNDPWSTGAFKVRRGNHSYRFFVEGLNGNHGANISALSSTERSLVLNKIAQWLNVPAPVAPGRAVGEVLPSFDPPSREELFLR